MNYLGTPVVSATILIARGKPTLNRFTRFIDVFMEKNYVGHTVSTQESEVTHCGEVLGETTSASDNPENRHAP